MVLPWAALAEDPLDNPLEPIDTSSPRGTLQGFLEFTDEAHRLGIGRLKAYLASSESYLSAQDAADFQAALERIRSAERAMDLSQLPPATAEESSRRLAAQLKSVLEHLELPPIASVPDAAAMKDAEFKRWAIPGTEIRIRRMESGPRAGEYLFDAETVARLPEFYEKVKDQPSRAGMDQGWYELLSYSPSGLAMALRQVVPPRWFFGLPRWTESIRFLDQPVWRWAGIAVVLGLGLAVVLGGFRLGRLLASRSSANGVRWANLLRPLSLVLVAPVAAILLSRVLRVSGGVHDTLTLSLWGLFFLALAWAVWDIGGAVAESVISAERLRESSIDSQLIRLVVRLLTLIVVVAILVVGGDRIGLPAYSVVAGLGVGGLAVALAAQQTLANLLGSLIIMFEKPFAIGHWIKVNDIEGVVEDVGFRSTRIRTFYNSLVTIPSSDLVSSTVDNMERREYRRVKTLLSVTYDTPAVKIEDFIAGIRGILESHPATKKDEIRVAFNEFGASSLDILLIFFIKVPGYAAELAERQRIFLAILTLAEKLGVRFAFPTQTLHVESLPEAGTKASASERQFPVLAAGLEAKQHDLGERA